MEIIGIFSLFISLFLSANALAVLLHEFGHAIPFLLYTKDDVVLHIGTYGNERNTVKLKFGRLTLFLVYNRVWRRGMCTCASTDLNVKLISLYMGPIASFMISISGCSIVFLFEMHGFLKLFFVFFAVVGTLDLLTNLYTPGRGIKMDNGLYIRNDADQIAFLKKSGNLFSDLNNISQMLEEKRFKEVISLIDATVAYFGTVPDLCRVAMLTHFMDRDYEKAFYWYDELEKNNNLTAYDFHIHGLINLNFKRYDESLVSLDKAAALDPQSAEVFINRGFLYSILGEYEAGLNDLNVAIDRNPKYSFSYSSRAYIYIKQNRFDDALIDLKLAGELNPDEPYLHRNYGIYHLEHNNPQKALEYFLKAKELEQDTFWIEDLIAEAEGKLFDS